MKVVPTLMITLFAIFGLHAEVLHAATVHVVIAADGRAGLGENLKADYVNMARLFRENIPAGQLKMTLMKTHEITPENILRTVSETTIGSDDTFVFYYSGHGANDNVSGGHYFQLKDRLGKPAELQRRTLLAKMKAKNARLTVLLTDCCNLAIESADKEAPVQKNVTPPQKITPVFAALFVEAAGVVDITSSKRGEASFVDVSEKKRGSCFTWPLVELFDKHRNNAKMTWPDFVVALRPNVQKAFAESWPGGYKFDPPMNGVVLQKTQTVTVFGQLPGEVQPEVSGPRFGARAMAERFNRGLVITEIAPVSPAQRVGFEIGDIITEINGKKIRTEQEYSDAVDLSGKSMRVKVINVNDKQLLDVTVELRD